MYHWIRPKVSARHEQRVASTSKLNRKTEDVWWSPLQRTPTVGACETQGWVDVASFQPPSRQCLDNHAGGGQHCLQAYRNDPPVQVPEVLSVSSSLRDLIFLLTLLYLTQHETPRLERIASAKYWTKLPYIATQKIRACMLFCGNSERKPDVLDDKRQPPPCDALII